jgi:pyruvate dehydrogenase E2 component (dihydrolipoyllysine-residue acetyltransferase)
VAFEFRLPDLGEGIREAQVLAWKVAPGQDVAAFQALCEVESAKAAVELTAPVAGRVRETRFSAGDVAHLGDVLVVIDTDVEGTTAATPPSSSRTVASAAAPATPGAEAVASEAAAVPRGAGVVAAAAAAAMPGSEDAEWFGIVGSPPARAEVQRADAGGRGRVRAAPFVRKLARDLGVPLEGIAGSGLHGRVLIGDVEAASAHAPVPALQTEPPDPGAAPQPPAPAAGPQPPATGERTIPLRGLRKSIADHLLTAWRTAPQVTSMDLFDVTELVRVRQTLAASAQAEGVRLSYVPLFVKAAVEALKAVPEANAVVDQQREAIVLKAAYHVGVATAVPGGLVVPVVKHADRLSVLELAREIERLVSAARERRSTPADLSGGTFTITSFGGLPGSPLFATPILNAPEVAILGLGRIELQPRVVDGQIVPRQCLGVSLTFDHRVLDGEGAGRFMAAFKRVVEQPLELLLHLK